MWDLLGPGLEPVSPALAGGFLTTEPAGKPCFVFKINNTLFFDYYIYLKYFLLKFTIFFFFLVSILFQTFLFLTSSNMSVFFNYDLGPWWHVVQGFLFYLRIKILPYFFSVSFACFTV